MNTLKEGVKETFNVETVIMILVAFVSYTVARLLQSYAFSKVTMLATVPEVADVATMVGGAALTKGDIRTGVVVGAGLALLNDLGSRFGVAWLKVA